MHVLQGSQARVVARRTHGSAVCPLGRCEVKASVPEVDQDLESEMQSRLGFRQPYTPYHTTYHTPDYTPYHTPHP